MASHESSWPGERDPSRHDVELANELPEPLLLSNFKTILLSSQDAEAAEQLMSSNFSTRTPTNKRFTYPASLLFDFPCLRNNDVDLVYLRQVFTNARDDYSFFRRIALPPLSRENVAPPLCFGLACLGSVYALRPAEESRDLFLAGIDLWAVMMEVDNREARSLDMITASILLATYGILTTDEMIWKRSSLMLASSITIACRMRLQDPSHLEDFLAQGSAHGSLVWILWLIDVSQALHLNTSPHFSSGELWTKMPSAERDFQDVYRALLEESKAPSPFHTSPLPEATSREDALLLLIALLSDSICLRRALGHLIEPIASTHPTSYSYNPFVPFTPSTEYHRMQALLCIALERWHTTFHSLASAEMLALYYYCRLYLSCPELPLLPQLAGYGLHASSNPDRPSRLEKASKVSHESARLAWLVLENVASPKRTLEVMCPMWLPIVVFHAALVVWAKSNLTTKADDDRYGSIKALLAFQVELENMCWPCCVEMVVTLKRLDTAGSIGR